MLAQHALAMLARLFQHGECERDGHRRQGAAHLRDGGAGPEGHVTDGADHLVFPFEPAKPAPAAAANDELGVMASKVSLLSERLRGAQFEVSGLRGNIDRLLLDPSRAELRAFVEKASALILQGVHLLVIDLFPPTKRDPDGIHKAIWDEFADEDFPRPAGKPLVAASYDAEAELQQRIRTINAEARYLWTRLRAMGVYCTDSHANFLYLPACARPWDDVFRDSDLRVRGYADGGVRISIGSRHSSRAVLAAVSAG